MEISTAHKGKPHISAEMWAELNRGIFGSESYVSEGGQKFKSELVSNNLLKIHDGSGMMQGRHVFIPAGQSDELTIENGNQGMKRIDLVVVRYTKDENTKIENTETVVIKGTPSASNPAVPAHIEGDIRLGDMKADWPLYEVELEGITVVEVRPVFKAILNMSTINKSLSDLPVSAVYRNAGQYNIASSSGDFKGTDFGTKIFDNIGLQYNYDSDTYKHTFTFPTSGIYLIHAHIYFADAGFTKESVLYGKLEVDDIEQSRQSKAVNNYCGADYIFLNQVSSGSKVRFTLLQNSGQVIKVGGNCRLNIVRFGK